MEPPGQGGHRAIRPAACLLLFLLCALILFLTHASLLRLPYYWDEAGQFVPAALDVLHGHWIPRSTVPNIHPPGVMAYLAAAWRAAGYRPATTRCGMLLLASFGVLAAFALARELDREKKTGPALLAAAFLCASPLFFAQAMLAQLDAPAMLFTALSLLWFLRERMALSAAASLALVMVKETGIVVPLVLALWLLHERRGRDALWFLAPAAALGVWVALLARATGHWSGNAEFARYNLYYPAHPVRLAVTLLRRLYYLSFANLHWVGGGAVAYALAKGGTFCGRTWKVAWLLVAAHVLLFTVLGGAALERYLLPVIPILYAAMSAGLSRFRPAARAVCSLGLLGGLAAGNFINPPYPFPLENNLAFTDFIALHERAAEFLAARYPGARIHTMWPLTAELSEPALGYVHRGLQVETLPDLAPATLAALDWSRVEVLVAFSRDWKPPFGWTPPDPARSVTREEARARIPLPLRAQFESRGLWVDVYVKGEAAGSLGRRAPRLSGSRSSGGEGRAGRGRGPAPAQVFAQDDDVVIEIPAFMKTPGLASAGAWPFGRLKDTAPKVTGDELELVRGQTGQKPAGAQLLRAIHARDQSIDQRTSHNRSPVGDEFS